MKYDDNLCQVYDFTGINAMHGCFYCRKLCELAGITEYLSG